MPCVGQPVTQTDAVDHAWEMHNGMHYLWNTPEIHVCVCYASTTATATHAGVLIDSVSVTQT